MTGDGSRVPPLPPLIDLTAATPEEVPDLPPAHTRDAGKNSWPWRRLRVRAPARIGAKTPKAGRSAGFRSVGRGILQTSALPRISSKLSVAHAHLRGLVEKVSRAGCQARPHRSRVPAPNGGEIPPPGRPATDLSHAPAPAYCSRNSPLDGPPMTLKPGSPSSIVYDDDGRPTCRCARTPAR